MKYRCVDSFEVENYDENGSYDLGSLSIMAGTMWERDLSDNRIIGGAVRLDNPETMEWLEIPFSTFVRYFNQVD